MEQLVVNAEKLVVAMMVVRDASHDAAHAFRVRDLTLSLTKEEGLEYHIIEIVELVTLFYDIGDYKYTKYGTMDTKVVQKFLVPWMRDGEDYKASFVGDLIPEHEARKPWPEWYQK